MNTPAWKTRTILWGAILASTLVLAALAVMLPPPPEASALPLFPVVFGALAAAIAVVSFVLPARVVGLAMKRLEPEVRDEVDAEVEGEYRDVKRVRVLRLEAPALERLLFATQAPFIMSLALSEVSSLLGLMLNRLGEPLITSAPFLAAGTLLVALRFPSQRALLAGLEKALGARVILEASGAAHQPAPRVAAFVMPALMAVLFVCAGAGAFLAQRKAPVPPAREPFAGKYAMFARDGHTLAPGEATSATLTVGKGRVVYDLRYPRGTANETVTETFVYGPDDIHDVTGGHDVDLEFRSITRSTKTYWRDDRSPRLDARKVGEGWQLILTASDRKKGMRAEFR
jgi:hypothetical protein